MYEKNNLFNLLLLISSFIFILVVRYLYEKDIINNWSALFFTVVTLIIINYSLIKKMFQKLKMKFMK